MDDSLAMTIEALQTSEYYMTTIERLKSLTMTYTHTLFDYNDMGKSTSYYSIDLDPVDKYRHLKIKKVLGKGAFSEVFHAVNESTGEEFAIRLTNINNRNYTLGRAKNEIGVYNQLKLVEHKNIAKVFKSRIITDEKSQDLQIIMELGICSLETIVRNRRAAVVYWSESELLRVATDLISGLALVQTFGLNHRDISLNNIVLSKNLGDYKLIDFGEAIHFAQNLDDMPIVGKMRYLAPELLQILGDIRLNGPSKVVIDYDLEKADVYSLGIVLLSMAGLEQVDGSDSAKVTLAVVKIQKTHPKLYTLLSSMIDQDPNNRKRFSQLRALLSNWDDETSACIINELEFIDDSAELLSNEATDVKDTIVDGDYHIKNGLYKEAIQIYMNAYRKERYVKGRQV